jgi:hypothetical protein
VIESREELVRRLLGVATQLFLDDKDPISVHCLASSAGEHAAELAAQAKAETLNQHILKTFPERSLKEIRKLRNRDWNAIKHSKNEAGQLRIPEAELKEFKDAVNDHMLFIVWYDFMMSGAKLPIPAQVYQVWYFELYQEKVRLSGENTSDFGGLVGLPRKEQKQRLNQLSRKFSTDEALLKHEGTDPRPLVF